jgi:hypothetical protein
MMSSDKPPSDDDEQYRIHFLNDLKNLDSEFNLEDLDSGHKCLRCGFIAVTKEQMYEHRKGLLSPCFKRRVKQWITQFGGNNE